MSVAYGGEGARDASEPQVHGGEADTEPMGPPAVARPSSASSEAVPGASVPDGPLESTGLDAPGRRRWWAVAVGLGALGVVGAVVANDVTLQLMSVWVVLGVAIPLGLWVRRPAVSAASLTVVVVLVLAVPGLRTAAAVLDQRGDAHDGGVLVTQAAADALLDGRNPYTADFTSDLPPEWQRVTVEGRSFDNPIRHTYPYLPGAFLAMVPTAALDAGSVGDPRWIMLATYALTVLALARTAAPRWARIGTLLSITGPIVVNNLALGTNDTWAASLFVLGLLTVARRPWLAGLLLALAVSVKALLLAPVLVWLAWRWSRGGRASITPLWTLPVALAVTGLPFLVWAPRAMVDDTIGFWLGLGEDAFPASGYGLAAHVPSSFPGVVLGLITLTAAMAGVAGAWRVLRGLDHPLAMAPAAAVVLLGVLVPARTFQGNYLVLVVGLVAPLWIALAGRGDPEPSEHRVGAARPVTA